jgi:hypothetical protein
MLLVEYFGTSADVRGRTEMVVDLKHAGVSTVQGKNLDRWTRGLHNITHVSRCHDKLEPKTASVT